MKDCLFCKIVRRETPAHIVAETNDVIVFLSLENHPLIVPKKHIKDIYDLDDENAQAVMSEAVKAANAVKTGLECDGINLVQSSGAAAGQSVFHFHLHIKPRWTSDHVVLQWNTRTVDDQARLEMAETLRTSLSDF